MCGNLTKPSLAEGFFMTKRAVIFANGEMPAANLVIPLLTPDDTFIAVDGGLRHLRALQKVPKLLIGDLDSVSPEETRWAEEQSCEIMRFKVDKDETDLELALLEAVKKGFEEILVIAGLGGRLDQTLANLFLLMLPELAGIKVSLSNGIEEAFLIRDSAEIEGQVGDIVSLIPLNGRVSEVETQNLKYPLEKETLFPEKSRGISNGMLGKRAKVSIASGCLLCIHTRFAG
jgi:thiamine pyrophosphokinase